MGKEFLTLHIGQAGIQTSHALWELICMEHGIGADGIMKRTGADIYPGENAESMFYELKSSRFVPRALLMDLEPTVVDEVRTGCYRDLWNPSNLVNQKEDAASNFARGYYTTGKVLLNPIIERITQEAERCDNLAAFECIHSFAGGTGSGFGALLCEKLNELFGKKFKFAFGVYPSPTLSEIMVEAYNTILHTYSNITNEDCVILFDNESLFHKVLTKIKVSQPTFTIMNRLLSQMFSSITLSHRYNFFGSQHADVTELLTNLIPYPRIHFPLMSYSPLLSFEEKDHESFNFYKLTSDVFDPHSHLVATGAITGKYISCCMLYRGSVSPKPILDSIARIKNSRDINFVDWCPTGFKIGLNTCPPIQVPKCEQAVGENALCMITGNTSVQVSWTTVANKFDLLLTKRAFVHWYVMEGIEESDFSTARDDIQSLILDYEELAAQDVEEKMDHEMDIGNINDKDKSLPLKTEVVNNEQTLEDNNLNNNYNTNTSNSDNFKLKLSNFENLYDKRRSLLLDSDSTSSNSKKNTVKNIVKKCNKMIVESSSLTGAEGKVDHVRTNVAKYLNNSTTELSLTSFIKKPKVYHFETVQTSIVKDKTISDSISADKTVCSTDKMYCSSEFMKKCEMMKNNNRCSVKSHHFTFKTAGSSYEQRCIGYIHKSNSKNNINIFYRKRSSKKESITSDDSKSYSITEHEKDSNYINTSNDLILNDSLDENLIQSSETLKLETSSSPQFRSHKRSSTFNKGKLEIRRFENVVCDPSVT